MAEIQEWMREEFEKQREIAEYTKLPVTIIAFRWFGDERQMETLFQLLGPDDLPHAPDDPHVKAGFGFTPSDGRVTIPTLEGTMTASPGDWIIRGIKGELYPCKADIFADSYQAAGDSQKGQ